MWTSHGFQLLHVPRATNMNHAGILQRKSKYTLKRKVKSYNATLAEQRGTYFGRIACNTGRPLCLEPLQCDIVLHLQTRFKFYCCLRNGNVSSNKSLAHFNSAFKMSSSLVLSSSLPSALEIWSPPPHFQRKAHFLRCRTIS